MNTDAAEAGREAAERARMQLAMPGPYFALVFASSWFDQFALLHGVRSVLHKTALIGASTAGEITPDGPMSHSCVVLLVGSETLLWSVGIGEGLDRVPREAGQQAAYTALQGFRGTQRSGFLLLGDGLVTSYADVVRGIQEVLGTNSLIAGGLAGDDLRYEATYQYCNHRVTTRSVVGVLLGGGGRLGVGMEHGFAPISKPRHVTRSRANVLVELDRQPAASVYEEYFGEERVRHMRQERLTRPGMAYPLGIQTEPADHWLLRNVVAFRDDGSLACSAEIPEGSWLQLMVGSRELALDAARRAAQEAIQSLNRVAAVVVFDSVVRRMLLGPRQAAEEVQRIRNTVGPSVPLIGCYTYGEQAPCGAVGVSGRAAVQTGSVLVVALGT